MLETLVSEAANESRSGTRRPRVPLHWHLQLPEFRLDIRCSGGCHHNITGAGILPTVEKTQQVAEDTARRHLHGASVNWEEHFCLRCDERLAEACNALRRTRALWGKGLSYPERMKGLRKCESIFRGRLIASFKEAQTAWDAYPDHLNEHGLLPTSE